jgi:plastocyanin
MLRFPALSTHICRIPVRIGAVLLAAGLLAACGGQELTGNAQSGPAPGDAIEIEAGDNFFEPEEIEVTPGEEVTVEINNTGDAAHDWTAEELELSTGVIPAGEVFHATFTAPDGDVEFVCTLHRGMDGTIKVA